MYVARMRQNQCYAWTLKVRKVLRIHPLGAASHHGKRNYVRGLGLEINQTLALNKCRQKVMCLKNISVSDRRINQPKFTVRSDAFPMSMNPCYKHVLRPPSRLPQRAVASFYMACRLRSCMKRSSWSRGGEVNSFGQKMMDYLGIYGKTLLHNQNWFSTG